MNIWPQVAFVGSNVILSVILRAINICVITANILRIINGTILLLHDVCFVLRRKIDHLRRACAHLASGSHRFGQIHLLCPEILLKKASFVFLYNVVIVYLTAESAPGRWNGRWTVKVWELILIMMPQSAIFSAEHSQHPRAQSQIVAVRASWYPVQYRYYQIIMIVLEK